MKHWLTLIFVALMALPAIAQDVHPTEVPARVQASFQEQYPQVVKSAWAHGEEGEYAVTFTVDGQTKHQAFFSGQGKWNRTETKLVSDPVLVDVAVYVKGKYPDRKVKTAIRIEQPGKKPAVHVTVTDPATQEELTLAFSNEGAFIKVLNQSNKDKK